MMPQDAGSSSESDKSSDSGVDRGHETSTPPSEATSGPLVALCNVTGEIDGSVLIGLLRAEGIGALATADLDPSILPTGTSDSGSILVVESELSRARRILEDYRLSTFAVGIVLAAGSGTRMGLPKGLVPVRGRRLIDELVEAYSASLARELVVVVAPDSPLTSSLDGEVATVLTNPHPSRGQLSSLWIALDELGDSADAILLHPVDVPMFDPDLIDDLIQRYSEGEGPILVPTFEGKRGHPVLFGKQCFQFLREASLDVGARQVLHDHPDLVSEVPTGVPWVTMDLNTPEQLERFLQAYGPGAPSDE